MKTQLLIILLLIGVFETFGQGNKEVSVGLSAGISNPVSDYQNYTKSLGNINELNLLGFKQEITGQTYFELNGSYNFGGFGVSMGIGIFKHEFSKLTYERNISTRLMGGDINGSTYILGPEYTKSFGDFRISGSLRGGIMDFSLDKFSASYNGNDTNQTIEILSTELAPESKSIVPMAALGITLSYPIYKKLYATISADYQTSFGDGFKIMDKYYTAFDADNDGNIGIDDVNQFVNIEYLREDTRFLKFQALNFGVGLGYSFGDNIDNIEKERKATVTAKEAEEIRRKHKLKKAIDNEDSDGDGLSDDDLTDDIVFENANNKRRRSDGGNVIVVLPLNNSRFSEAKEIEKFSWELLDNYSEKPNFRIELFKIGENLELQSIYAENISKKEINHEAAHIVQQKIENSLNDSGEGHFKWKITEIITGITSRDTFFRISNCTYEFSLMNESVECLDSDTDNRILKICFDSYFSSPFGDLTFGGQQSGLILYDQNFNALTYQLINPNPSLTAQAGSGGMAPYCLKVTVPNGVTSLGIRLRGDVINTGRDKCTPVSYLSIADLPFCACDECTNKSLVVNNLSITKNGANLNQFNISANLTATTQIFGIEFQIQSYEYTAYAANCTDGVTSIEESGMFLIPSTTINNAPVAIYNESISSSGNTNDLATKTIQYKTSTPITGVFPVNLTIGVPGPAQGQDTTTCRIVYKICIKAKVYFEDGSCTTCVFGDCFIFDNQ